MPFGWVDIRTDIPQDLEWNTQSCGGTGRKASKHPSAIWLRVKTCQDHAKTMVPQGLPQVWAF